MFPSQTPRLTIEITSDTTCPYCYIGYKRLLRAIALTNAQRPVPIEFQLHFLPFQLDSHIPPYPGDDRRELLYSKFGQENFERMEKKIIDDGRNEGLNIKFQGRLSSTLDSHRVLSKAWDVKGEEAQMVVAELLFKKYFEEGEDQADPEVLADALERAGVMSKEEAKDFIASDELTAQVQEEFLLARKKGITTVPTFIIDGKYTISSTQNVPMFVSIFKALTENWSGD